MTIKNCLVISAVLALSACVPQEPQRSLSEITREICTSNGFKPGTSAFNNCFNATYQQVNAKAIADRQRAAAQFKRGIEMMTQTPTQHPLQRPQSCFYNGYRMVCDD